MARPVNPKSKYTVKPHVTHGHIYASTQPWTVDPATGRKVYRYVHWGTVIDGRFIPGAKYVRASPEERARLIFPEEWDLGAIESMSGRRGPGRPASGGEDRSRLYGDVWLLEKIAEKLGIRRDLMAVFGENREVVDEILTLAYFPYLTKWSYSRAERWQNIERTPGGRALTPKEITLLSQSVTERHRMDFLRLRLARLGKDEVCAVDSTTRSAYGGALADIRWGTNKERLPLEQTTEAVVYTLDSHLPVYYRTFPGNIPDSRSLREILSDLSDAGMPRAVLVTDRGYDCMRNLETYIARGQPMVMCMRTSQSLVSERIDAFGKFDCVPEDMELDLDSEVYFRQYAAEYPVRGLRGQAKPADRFRINLYFDPVRRAAEKKAVDLDVGRQRRALGQILAEGSALDDDASLKRLYGYFDLRYDPATRRLESFSENRKKIDSARSHAGFRAIGTLGVDFTAMETLRHYGLRDEQEKYFQQMKDQMAADRQRTWSEEGKTGRLFILFVSLMVASHVRHVWKTTDLHEKFRSSLDILDEMRSIRCIEHARRAVRITPFVGKQLDICRAFGFDVPKGCGPEYLSVKVDKPRRGRPRNPAKGDL